LLLSSAVRPQRQHGRQIKGDGPRRTLRLRRRLDRLAVDDHVCPDDLEPAFVDVDSLPTEARDLAAPQPSCREQDPHRSEAATPGEPVLSRLVGASADVGGE
jgi:hypothetical protein